MKYGSLLAIVSLLPAWSQVVKPTAGALNPINSAPAAAAPPTSAAGVPAKTGGAAPSPVSFRRMESNFDYQLKTADEKNPFNLLALTRGLYLPGYGVVFTAEVELVQNQAMPMFRQNITAETKAALHDRKIRHLDLLRKQMADMIATSAKDLTFLGPNEKVVVAIRLWYDTWEDKTGLPDQIVMTADKRGASSGDIKVEIQ
jgi:hypothetical protein